MEWEWKWRQEKVKKCKGSKSKIKCQQMGIFVNTGGKGHVDYWRFLDS